MVTRRVRIESTQEALALLGDQDSALRKMERDYGVEIFLRQDVSSNEFRLSVKGTSPRVEKAMREIRARLSLLRAGRASTSSEAATTAVSGGVPLPEEALYRTAFGKLVRARTRNQERYVAAIQRHHLVFGIGPAGTGKTFLAVVCALRALESREVNRIIVTRPVVEAGERLGFLPGDVLEKVTPYLKPIYDAFYNLLGPERFRAWRNSEVIEIVPLAYMRGRTFENAFILLDEAQNTTPEQMKMFLTRMGIGSRMAVTGDVTQNDLGEKITSGLVRVAEILKDVEGVVFHSFGEEDIVRHPLVRRIIRAYGEWEKKR